MTGRDLLADHGAHTEWVAADDYFGPDARPQYRVWIPEANGGHALAGVGDTLDEAHAAATHDLHRTIRRMIDNTHMRAVAEACDCDQCREDQP